jgi:hypothetical protein
MSNILDLFKGVGVIIDDALANPNIKIDTIWKIKQYFEDKHIPILSYSELPDDENIKNFNTVSFLLLDWELSQLPIEDGVKKPDLYADNIDFIKKFNSVCFAPIFIFSNDQPQSIIKKLTDANLYDESKSNHIFVKHKSELKEVDLFTVIEEWLKQTSSIYVMKEWDLSLQKAKNDLFWDFYKISPYWVNIFHNTTTQDHTSLSYEMGELLFENLKTRCTPVKFDNDIITNQSSNTTISLDEIRNVLEGQRFRKKENIPDDMIFIGDIFCKDAKYFINVRPQCDCIPRESDQTIDDIKLYLIEGEEKTDMSNFNNKFGVFNDIEMRFTAFPVCGNKAIQFNLSKFTIEQYKEWKEYRVGILLPPFITKLIQKYALYMQRQGLPRIPKEAVK